MKETLATDRERARLTPPQDVARAFGAACTPDFFLFDHVRRLYYRGQFDNSRPGDGRAVTGSDLRHAMESCLHGKPAPTDQWPSLGCSIKWHPEGPPGAFG